MPQPELNLRDYFRIVRRRIWTIVLSLVLVLCFTILYTNQQTPIYQTSTTVTVEQRTNFSGLLAEYFTYNPGDVIATEQNVITSYSVIEKVCRVLGRIDDKTLPDKAENTVNRIKSMVATERVGTSNAIRIKAMSDHPAEAAALANALARTYKDFRFEQRNKETLDARQFVEEQLVSIKEKLRESEDSLRDFLQSEKAGAVQKMLKDRLASMRLDLFIMLDKYTEDYPSVKKLRKRIDELEKKLRNLPSDEMELTRLEREVQINEQSYNLLNQKYKEALISESHKFSPITILSPAPEPAYPTKPNKPMNMVVGVLIGLMLGFVFASIKESLDTSIGTIEEVEEYLKTSVLGLIPHIHIDQKRFKGMSPDEEKKARLQANLVLQYDPKSAFAEAYRVLQTNIKISYLKRQETKVLLFTSATSNEGKTITTANYALACAQTGLKVLLIDADMRKPSLYYIFGVSREPGLIDAVTGSSGSEECFRGTTDFLLGGLDADVLRRTSGIENLRLLPTTYLLPNPLTFLDSQELTDFIDGLRDKFDLIIIDSPPILPVADSIILGGKVDGVILVYQAGRTARGALKRSATQLTNAGANLLGVVLNEIKVGEMDMGHAYYYSYQTHQREKKNWFERIKKWFLEKTK